MIWNFNPIAFSVFGVTVRWYGLTYLLGAVFGATIGFKTQKKLLKQPLHRSDWIDLVSSTLIAGIIGGRLGEFLFYQTDILLSDPLEVLAIWNGGMSIHGGILGAALYLWFFTKSKNISFLRMADSLVIPLSLSLAFGRIANFINGELPGQPTNTDWGVIFPHVDNVLRHPTQLYESGWSFITTILLALLFWTHKTKKGNLSAWFLVLYGVGRFIIEFWKTGNRYGEFTIGQYLCMVMVVFAIGIWYKHTKNSQ